MILLPVSFLIKPKIMYGMQFMAMVVFCISVALVKEDDYVIGDILTCVLFFLISIVIAEQINRIRINNINMAEQEQQRRIELEAQSNLLSVALGSANMCAWEYDCATMKMTPTYTPTIYRSFEKVMEAMPEAAIRRGLIHPGSIETIRVMYRRLTRGEASIQGEIQIRAEETAPYIWFHISMIPEGVQETKPSRYIGTCEDVTERKNIEHQYEEQLRMLDSANDANLITKGRWNLTADRQELQICMSSLGLDLSEFSTYEAAKKRLLETVFPATKREEMSGILDREELIREFRKGRDRYNFEYQRMSNGAPVWINLQIRICKVPGREDVMCFGFSYDITEEVLNRNIINKLVSVEYDFLGTVNVKTSKSIVRSVQKRIEESINHLGAFHSQVDYEESARAAAEMAVIPEELGRVIEGMKLANVINHLEEENTYFLTFTTEENGVQSRKKLEYVYLDDSRETILYYRSDITEVYRQEQEQLQKLKEALSEVEKANAAKTDFLSRMSHDMRTPMNGIIGMTRLTQEITALPESDAFLEKIYEPFSQENSALSTHQVGTGLGMSIVKNLVELMGGTIEIESTQSIGTKVTIHLRAERVLNYVPKEQSPESDYRAVLTGKRVLLVEDHPLNLLISQKMLEKMEMKVVTATNGREAVARFTESELHTFDAILMDIQMPVMNGIEATRAIRALAREDARTVAIIATSANAFAEDVARSREAGMNDHLSKPVAAEQVYAALAKYMN